MQYQSEDEEEVIVVHLGIIKKVVGDDCLEFRSMNGELVTCAKL